MLERDAEVVLTVGRDLFSGWKSIRITRGIEQIAGSFELTVSERWPGQDVARPVKPGQACTVAIGGEIVQTGYVDEVRPSYDSSQHEVTVAGRDRTGDLVDCSVVHSGEWKNRTLLQVAKEVCDPFGVQVRASVSVGGAFRTAAIQPGETAFEALERAARFRGVLLVADGRGGLEITRASRQRVSTPLVRGENILSASGTLSWSERFSRIIVKGDDAGSDWGTPEQAAQPQGEARDPAIDRYRPLVLLAEHPGGAAGLSERAKWETAVRMGRGTKARITVQGWRHAEGLWQANRLVRVQDDWLGVDRDLLISSVAYIYDDKGRRCELELVRPEAFDLRELPEPTTGGTGWGE